MEIFSESYKTQKEIEDKLLSKWEPALEADGGIKDPHMARTTAILLENYMTHLKKDNSLVNESIASSDFKGVNLALLGLIRRAIPALVGAELVGIQAMPTPTSPIFYMSWKKSMYPNGSVKGTSQNGQEYFGYSTAADGQSNPGALDQADPFFTSSQVRSQLVINLPSTNSSYGITVPWAPIIGFTVRFRLLDSTGAVVGSSWINQATPTSGVATGANGGGVTAYSGGLVAASISTNSASNVGGVTSFNGGSGSFTSSFTSPLLIVTTAASLAGGTRIVADWEYNQESNTQAPEVGVNIDQFNVSLVRRMLRGKFSLDSMTDAQAYHGISLENELMEIMKYELTNEINREIINDLRTMSGIANTIDYSSTTLNNTSGNYDDSFKLILDAINGIGAEILNQTRLGRGNFVVGNPVTLAFLDRVPGFVGAGVSYDGKGLSYAGQIGNRVKFYSDPQYVKNELLVGYKGPSAIDTGYIHAPYLPITATPTLLNPETGDPSKIFYTRYGKTYRDFDKDKGTPSNAIYRGQYCYGRLFMQNFPTI
jgi:hypothetical protein